MSQREDLYRHLAYIALREFPDVVVGTEIVEGKLRVFIVDKSFIDVWFSEKEKVYTHTIGRKERPGASNQAILNFCPQSLRTRALTFLL